MIRNERIHRYEVAYSTDHVHKCAIKYYGSNTWALLRMSHVLVMRRIRRCEGLPYSPKTAVTKEEVAAFLNAAD